MPIKSVKIVDPKKQIKSDLGNKNEKIKANRNGKIGVNKKNDYAYSPKAIRKVLTIVILLVILRMNAKR